MPSTHDDLIVDSIRQYREALVQTRDLYRDSGTLIRGSYGWLRGSGDGQTDAEQNAESIAQQMDDLHQGFVMKIFATIVPGTQSQTLQQRQLGRILLEHIWGKSVMGGELRQAVDWLINAAAEFHWSDLVRPFAELPSIRDRFSEIETLAMRMAKLIAAIDGSIDNDDQASIKAIMLGLKLADGGPVDVPGSSAPAPAAGTINHKSDTDAAREALDWLRREAKRLSTGAAIVEPESRSPGDRPTPTPIGGRPPAATPAAAAVTAAPLADDRTAEQRLAEAREKLDQLIGLDAVKDQIQTLTNFLKMEKLRREADLPTTRPTLHMSFVGNPGTGKTSVARIIAEIYGALGILEKGHLVETDRSGLVAEYAGQTGPKTNAKIDEALDGVLFIDEAYTLIDESGQDQYGREAVQTLLKRMEDQRERLVVILAGYPNEMNKMIRSNPGLSSRVGTTMHFDDYSPEDLCRIFELIAKKSKYTLPTQSRRRLLRGFTYLYMNRDRHFGNGRTSRNSFEASVRRLANRLAEMPDVSRELLTTLQAHDIEVSGVDQAHLAAMADLAGKVRVSCDHCHHVMVIDDALLGTDVSCEAKQDETFFAAFGEPVIELVTPSPETADTP